jgi:tRNA pseudouridine55 synthase
LLGVETDTHDVLGKIVSTKPVGPESANDDDIRKALARYVGSFKQAYPTYSSKVVDGKPLFDYARQGRNVVLPMHEVSVARSELVSSRSVLRDDFWKQIKKDIDSVKGDFRQKEILALWESYIEGAPQEIRIYTARVTCGSGFYVRQLVSDIGRDLGCGAVTTSILRTRVGEFRLEDSIK